MNGKFETNLEFQPGRESGGGAAFPLEERPFSEPRHLPKNPGGGSIPVGTSAAFGILFSGGLPTANEDGGGSVRKFSNSEIISRVHPNSARTPWPAPSPLLLSLAERRPPSISQ